MKYLKGFNVISVYQGIHNNYRNINTLADANWYEDVFKITKFV